MKVLCELLGLTKSSYYSALQKNAIEPTKSASEVLLEEIKQIFIEDGQLYNGAQLYDRLKKRGFQGSLRKVQRVLKKAKEAQVIEVQEPIVNMGFETTEANEKWVVNISYVPTWHQGWVYIASIIDVHTKKLIGFSFDRSVSESLVVEALKKAYAQFAMPVVLYTSLQPAFIEHCKEASKEKELLLPPIVYKDYLYDEECLQAIVPFLTGTENRLRRGHASIRYLK
ncbi:DDE-type integrase/transposase/recombinase [Lysinibacillus sp. FSL W8-0992]|uniref:DDE-type integrase/transposase/recombinase n=1 Tax=Lysinibacillus sp. FSL W8-0992 TaxID=2954643 RepID=UPI0030FCE2C8